MTSQQQVLVQAASGQYVPGIRLAFETGTGMTGEVSVPEREATPEAVSALISAKVAQLAALHNLSG